MNKNLDKLYEKREKNLKEKLKNLSCENLLNIALDFLECKYSVESTFHGVKGFMFDENQLKFVVDESIDEAEKKEIREMFIGFTDFGKLLKKIKTTKQSL